MTAKKRILLLTTGGTIASVPGGEGLEPRRSEVMERELEQLRTYYDISVKDVICLDSSNIRPEEWQLIARHIFEDRDRGLPRHRHHGLHCLRRDLYAAQY